MVWIALIVFALLGLCSIMLILAGLPGTWMLLGLAMVMEFIDGWWLGGEGGTTFGWWVLVIAIVAAGTGELLEMLSGSLGAKASGGSRRAQWGAFGGGLLGALVGTFAIPIPIMGTLIGALLGTFLGALGAEMTGPDRKGSTDALGPAIGATLGHVLGIVAKLGVGIVVWSGLVAVAIARAA